MDECLLQGIKPSPLLSDWNPLLRAVFLGRLRLARLLLEGGAYVNESDALGHTPLMVAITTPHRDHQSCPRHRMVRYLLDCGADPNIQDKSGQTCLVHAVLSGVEPQTVSLLMGSGADPALPDHLGSSALVYAVRSGKCELLRLLVDACRAAGKEVIVITRISRGHTAQRGGGGPCNDYDPSSSRPRPRVGPVLESAPSSSRPRPRVGPVLESAPSSSRPRPRVGPVCSSKEKDRDCSLAKNCRIFEAPAANAFTHRSPGS
ncbi:ankyrin repeat domain-containing protein 34B-like [Eucyclogobius newberryi]|uniref:ankyrin repeat domain-containing protein 34B-like n=1 Tax=Eucyclogobius newberryi TaxID=166745 RepID=UPI003B5CCD37